MPRYPGEYKTITVSHEKGAHLGDCRTELCGNQSRWISVFMPPFYEGDESVHRLYMCGPCCDKIAELTPLQLKMYFQHVNDGYFIHPDSVAYPLANRG